MKLYRKVTWSEVGVGQIVYIQEQEKVIGPYYVSSVELQQISLGMGKKRTHKGPLLVEGRV